MLPSPEATIEHTLRERRLGHNTGSRLVQNTLTNLLGQIVVIGLTFFSTPFITRRLGAAQYGALSLLMTYLFAFSLLNLGINASLIKYLAELLPKNRLNEMQNYLSTSLTVLVGMGASLGIAVFILAAPIVHHFFKGPVGFAPSTILALRVASGAFILQFLIQVASSIPAAAQRFEFLNVVRAGSEALRIIVTVVLLLLGFGLPALMVVVLFSSLCACLAYTLISRRLVPGLHLVPGFSLVHLRSLLRHSRFVLLINLSNQLVSTADNFFIGLFLPIANVAYYAIAYTLAQRLTIFSANIISVVFPAASAFSASDKREQVKELYLRGMKVAAATMCFPAIMLCLFSHRFLFFWLGPDYAEKGATVLSLLAFGFLVNSFTYVPYQVLQATQHANTAAKGAIMYSILNVALFMLLIPRFGILGASMAFVLAQMLFVPWFVHKSNRLLGVRWRTVIVASLIRVFFATALGSLASWLCRPWIDSFVSLASVVALGLTTYLVLAGVLVLDARERSTCRFLLQRWVGAFATKSIAPAKL